MMISMKPESCQHDDFVILVAPEAVMTTTSVAVIDEVGIVASALHHSHSQWTLDISRSCYCSYNGTDQIAAFNGASQLVSYRPVKSVRLI